MQAPVKLSVGEVLQEGVAFGLKNALSIIGAILLWLLTCWIPYLNVGTTIALNSIPLALSKGKVISPTFIFESKYRKYMGEYFSLMGLMLIAIIPAFTFLIIPAIIISISWSLSLYLLLDKGINPSEAMMQSNKATYGHKLNIFLISLILTVALVILMVIFKMLGVVGSILLFITMICFLVISMGCQASIYKKLVLDRDLDSIEINDNKEPLFD